MSKVKITGNASGTGVVTLTAPNTNADRTITLPDGTGELLAKDSNGNVGIGTSSPTAKLDVNGSSEFGAPGSALDRPLRTHSYGNTNKSIIVGRRQQDVSRLEVRYDSQGSENAYISRFYGGSKLHFDMNGVDHMLIDSAGRVTMPYQPAFQASNHSAGNTTGNINYTHTLHNIGGHFNASTGRFTAPTAGMYSFSFHALTQNAVSTGNVEILINGGLPSGNTFRNYMDNSVGKHSPISIGGMFYLNANDYVSIYSPTLILHGNQSEHFSGHLIG